MALLRSERFFIGKFLILLGGILSFYSFSMNLMGGFMYSPILGLGLSFTVILGAILVYKEHVNLGCALALGPSLLFPLWLFLNIFLHPWPESVILWGIYQAFADSNLLLFSLIGVVLVMTTHIKEVP